jgi:hypothetical protein
MDKKTYMASVSEAKIIADFAVKGYDVFTQTNGKSPFDLVVYKNNKILRVQVKSCQKVSKRGKYKVQLKKVRHNKTQNKITKFDPNSCDVLAIYLFGADKICYLDPHKLSSLNEISVDPNDDFNFIN